MVWEQRCRGVVMLNRVIEKGSVRETHRTCNFDTHSLWIPAWNTSSVHMECVHEYCMWGLCCKIIIKKCVCVLQVKCAQYWPQREEREADFEDTNFRLTLISEDVKSYYTVRELELENLLVRHLISSHPVMLLLICQSLSLIILLFSTEILCSASCSHFSSIWPNSCFLTKNVECHVLYSWTACWLDSTLSGYYRC